MPSPLPGPALRAPSAAFACLSRCALVLAAALLAACLGPASAAAAVQAAAGSYDADFFAVNGAQEAILSEMTIRPAALRIGSVTYVGYQGPGYDPYVVAYDEDTGAWTGPVRAATNPLVLDAHGAPALFADAGGYLHILYGSHNTPVLHAVSLQPGSIEGWRDLPLVARVGTYPSVMTLPDDRTAAFMRIRDGFTGWGYLSSGDGGYTWDRYVTPVLTAGTGYNWYASFHPGRDGVVHAAFTRYDTTRVATGARPLRYDLFYAVRDAEGVWRNAAGTALTMPITRETAEQYCLVYGSSPAMVNEVVVKEDALGNPLLQFESGSGRGEGAWTWRFARRSGTGWAVSAITMTDHSFDSGTFDPRADGTVHSWVVAGGSEDRLGRVDTFEGRGGRVEHWVSSDGGASWSFSEVTSPQETGTLYGDPQVVEGGGEGSRLLFTEWTNDATNFMHRMYLYGDDGPVTRRIKPDMERLAGVDRVRTAVSVSKRTFPEGAACVLVATAHNFPDALAAAPLAQAMGGPILLTPTAALTADTVAEVKRLGANRAVLLGTSDVVSDNVGKQLMSQAGVGVVERIGGATRYETAAAIAARIRQLVGPQGTVVVVSGSGWADGLAAAPYAAWKGYPILLAQPGGLPTASRNALVSFATNRTVIVGGEGAVSPAVAANVPNPVRIGGLDRYDTAALFAAFGVDEGMLPRRFMLATGTNFADAVVSGVLGGHTRAPLLLTTPSTLSTRTASYLSNVETRTIDAFVLGGTGAVSSEAFDYVAFIVGALGSD